MVTLSAVIDCHTRELLGWRSNCRGDAQCAEETLEDALVNRFGTIARATQPLTLRSDIGLVITLRRSAVTVRSYGIKQEFITPHRPQQFGMIERLFRTMKEQCIWLHNFKAFESERNYWRAEVTLLEGAQQYDVAGYSKEELMSDILTQFENHLHLLHTDIKQEN